MKKKILLLILAITSLILAFCPLSWGAPPPHPVMENTPPAWFTNASGTAYYLVTPDLGMPMQPASGAVFQMQMTNPGSFPSDVEVTNPGSFPVYPGPFEISNPASFPTNMTVTNPASFPSVDNTPLLFTTETVDAGVPGFVTTPAGTTKVGMQVISIGKQVWIRIGTSSVLISGPGSELLTWAGEIDCGPGVPISYNASETASFTFRFGRR